MKTLTLSFTVLLFFLLPAVAQIPEIAWEKQLSASASHYFSDAVETDDGGFILAGAIDRPGSTETDLWLLKCNSSGDTLATKIFSNPGNNIPMRILALHDNGYLLAYINVTDGNVYNARLMAVDTEFREMWTKEAGKPSAVIRTDVATDNTGTLWWLNTFADPGGKPSASVSKIGSGGNTISDYSIEDKHPVEGYSIRALPDGTIGVSCRCQPAGELSSVQVMRMGQEGNILWKASVQTAGKNLTPQCLCCSPDNSMIVGGWAGMCYNPDSPAEEQIWDYDFLLSKIDAEGKVLWTQNYNREGSEKGTAVAVLPDGNIMAAGKCETSFTGSIGPWLLHVDENGKMMSDKIYKFRFVKDQVARIICTSDGGLLMVGPGYIDTDSRLSGWVRKLNPAL